MSASTRLHFDARTILGEAPCWDTRDGDLVWVDILGRRVHRLHLSDGSVRPAITFDADVGCAIPRRGAGLIVATGDALVLLDADAAGPRGSARIGRVGPGMRFNDGKCDSSGRLWIGTSPDGDAKGSAVLFRVSSDLDAEVVLDGITESNGLGWSPDDGTMYHVDSGTNGVYALDFDPPSGQVARRRLLISIPTEAGTPDGLAVDRSGGIWVALWNGWAVCRYWPDGTLDRTVHVPCRLVTSCAFGGPLLDELFITTASVGMSHDERRHQPGAGGLFSCRPGEVGLPTGSFAG